MRLRVCIGLLLLATGGCAHIPEHIRIDVDGNSFEVITKPAAPDDGDEG